MAADEFEALNGCKKCKGILFKNILFECLDIYISVDVMHENVKWNRLCWKLL